MGKGSDQPAPDYMGLADKMGQWNLGANQAQTMANRPNQYSPWGTTTWSQAPGGWNGPGGRTPTVGVGPLGGGDGSGGAGGQGGTGGYGGQGDGGNPGGSGERGIVGPGGPPPGGFSSGAPLDAGGGGANPWGIGAGAAPSDSGPAFQGGPQGGTTYDRYGSPSGTGIDRPGGSGGPPPNPWGIGGGGGSPSDRGPGWDPSANANSMPGQWSQTTTLNPDLQAAADAQMKLQNRRSGFGLDQFGQLSDAMKNPFSLGGLPQGGDPVRAGFLSDLDTGMAGRGRAEDALYGRSTSRLDPQWGQQEEQLRTRLANQGLDQNSEAFKNEMGNFGRAKNDAYSQAMQNAIAGGGQEQALQFGMGLQGNQQRLGAQAQGFGQAEQARGRTLSELLQQRELPINEMNALMNGQNVQNPQFGPFMGAGAAQSPNYLGAGQAQGQYNLQNQAMQNGMFGDIGQGVGTFAKFLPFLFGA